ncbi:hypothetical protein DOTSEDRAFT_22635 [Dothistroma septosporum NZE10]|uniref:Uncharacterized protein n=1 Tax=Dothistroma septosporum (strain NZE10 / CBS 128990) TaxID=675120 RepID=N1PUG1_DOTSN|nr:hypothetical protein DOTSEDRAFT_22635 [Dothistroma septosporum NZE10]
MGSGLALRFGMLWVGYLGTINTTVLEASTAPSLTDIGRQTRPQRVANTEGHGVEDSKMRNTSTLLPPSRTTITPKDQKGVLKPQLWQTEFNDLLVCCITPCDAALGGNLREAQNNATSPMRARRILPSTPHWSCQARQALSLNFREVAPNAETPPDTSEAYAVNC